LNQFNYNKGYKNKSIGKNKRWMITIVNSNNLSIKLNKFKIKLDDITQWNSKTFIFLRFTQMKHIKKTNSNIKAINLRN
jgi:hypothetical protein